MFMKHDRLNPDIVVLSDASGNYGCGAFSGSRWFKFGWVPGMEELHITIKELIPIVFAAAIWGDQWVGKSVQCRCDRYTSSILARAETSQ